MKMILSMLLVTTAFFVPAAKAAEVTGAGSTFIYPLISKWADEYKKTSGVAINYQSIGSGGGIKQIESKTVDFGATDMPLKSEELVKQELVQFPLISGAVVPVVHVEGLQAGQLKLDGKVLADIFIGKIKKWNDAAIASLNAGVKLPDQDIAVVHRADGSGTSFIWSNYLSKVSDEWKTKVGEGTAVNWPVGVGGKGNEGVAQYVTQLNGAIGYVEYAYALQNKMAFVQMKNKAGKFVQPELKSFSSAVSGADWASAKDYYLILTDADGAGSWPIAGSTFVLMRKSQADGAQAKQVLSFFKWAFEKGEPMAKDLNYVSLPKKVTAQIEKTWKSEIKARDGKAVLIP
jgi:phosphate transport system substrate-binding protein